MNSKNHKEAIIKQPLNRVISRIHSGVSVNAEATPAIKEQPGVLKVSAVTSGSFRPLENKHVSSPDEQKRLRSPVNTGDILMTRSNGSADLVGVCVRVRNNCSNLYLPDKLWRLEIADESKDDAEWLYQIICSHPVKQKIKALSSGSSGMRNISKDEFLGIRVHHPPLSEQKAIAGILSTWDRAIELTEQLIAAKQQRKQALMQQLLTGKTRLPGFDGEWTNFKLADLLKEIKRFVDWDDDQQYHLLSVRRRSGGMFDRETKFGRDIKTKKMMTTATGDFVIARMQAVHGAITVTPPECDGKHVSASYSTFVVRNQSLLHMPFLGHLSKLPSFYNLLLLSSYGVTIEKMTFNLPWFLSEKITIPKELNEQKNIATILDQQDSEIEKLKQKRSLQQAQKKGLMQQLLTGKVRVKGE